MVLLLQLALYATALVFFLFLQSGVLPVLCCCLVSILLVSGFGLLVRPFLCYLALLFGSGRVWYGIAGLPVLLLLPLALLHVGLLLGLLLAGLFCSCCRFFHCWVVLWQRLLLLAVWAPVLLWVGCALQLPLAYWVWACCCLFVSGLFLVWVASAIWDCLSGLLLAWCPCAWVGFVAGSCFGQFVCLGSLLVWARAWFCPRLLLALGSFFLLLLLLVCFGLLP